jgi:hypothetical protein
MPGVILQKTIIFPGKYMINVTIRFVDGSLKEFKKDDSFLAQLKALQNEGYEGKQLINELITDDWGPPPVIIEIKGKKTDGSSVNLTIPYN